MFIAFDLVTVALALLGFYTYPVIVAVVNVALGRETLDRPRVVALAWPSPGWSRSSPRSSIRRPGSGSTPIGFGLALAAALSQAVFVVISRTGYPTVPASQAMAVVLATTVVCSAGPRAALTGAGAALAFPLRDPSILPLLAVHRAVRGGDPVDPVPDRDPADRRDAGRDPDAVRAGRRRRAGRLAARRAAGADPGRRRAGDPRRGAHPAARRRRRAAGPSPLRRSRRTTSATAGRGTAALRRRGPPGRAARRAPDRRPAAAAADGRAGSAS